MEAGPQMRYELVVQKKERNMLSNHVPERRKVLKKVYFWFSKVHVSKRTQTENFNFLDFFYTIRSVGAKPQIKCANIFEDSETCEQCGDFGTCVGRLSM